MMAGNFSRRNGISRKRAKDIISKVAPPFNNDWWCVYCHVPIRPGTASIDHITPVSRGGKNITANLALCCKRCNRAKGSLPGDIYVNLLSHISTYGTLYKEDILKRLAFGGSLYGRR